MEATPGIEPGCADLQSAASPLRHVASMRGPACITRPFPAWQCPGRALDAVLCGALAAAKADLASPGGGRAVWLRCGRHTAAGWQKAPRPEANSMTDTKQQRINMVESQVRPSDVTDRRIIRAMLEVPREAFVPAALHAHGLHGRAGAGGGGGDGRAAAYLLAPRTFAKLRAAGGDRARRGGAGCGLRHRLLDGRAGAGCARRVVAVEADAASPTGPRRRCASCGVGNAAVVEGPLEAGAPGRKPRSMPSCSMAPCRRCRRRCSSS